MSLKRKYKRYYRKNIRNGLKWTRICHGNNSFALKKSIKNMRVKRNINHTVAGLFMYETFNIFEK